MLQDNAFIPFSTQEKNGGLRRRIGAERTAGHEVNKNRQNEQQNRMQYFPLVFVSQRHLHNLRMHAIFSLHFTFNQITRFIISQRKRKSKAKKLIQRPDLTHFCCCQIIMRVLYFYHYTKIDLKMVCVSKSFCGFNEICYMVTGDDCPREYLKVFIPTMVSQNL